MKNKFLCGFATGLFIIGIVGCTSILKNNKGVFGHAQEQKDDVDSEIRIVENQQAQVNEDKLAHIGAWSKGGVEYSLDQIPKTNVTREIVVAKEMNERIEALAGKPDFKEVEAVKEMVTKLLSENEKVRASGEKALVSKDKEINKLEQSVKELNHQREVEIANAMQQADINAQKADQYEHTLDQMDSWGGLGAIWYGFKRLVIRGAWILGIGGILFIILRVMAASNPIAGAIFSIFSTIGSWIIHTIEAILPKAAKTAGYVAQSAVEEYKILSTKLVDTIQQIKIAQPAASDVVRANINLTPDETLKVTEIKQTLNYK